MLGTLYVVISSSKEEDYQKVKEELLEIYPDFSVSPYKESQMEKDAVEFFATCQITKEKAQELLDKYNYHYLVLGDEIVAEIPCKEGTFEPDWNRMIDYEIIQNN